MRRIIKINRPEVHCSQSVGGCSHGAPLRIRALLNSIWCAWCGEAHTDRELAIFHINVKWTCNKLDWYRCSDDSLNMLATKKHANKMIYPDAHVLPNRSRLADTVSLKCIMHICFYFYVDDDVRPWKMYEFRWLRRANFGRAWWILINKYCKSNSDKDLILTKTQFE